MEDLILLKMMKIYKIQLRYVINIFCLLLISCGMNEKNEYIVSKDRISESEHSVNLDSLSVEEHLYNICDVSSSDDIILSDCESEDVVVVSFCYENDTINIVSFSDEIYKDLNMKIMNETTFQESLYVHISKNIPVKVDSALFAKYSQDKIMPCPEVTELYKTKGIGAVLWRYMKRERYIKIVDYIPDWFELVDDESTDQINIKKEKLNLIDYIVYLAFQHRIFFTFTIESNYRIDDKGVEVKERAQWEEMAEEGKIKSTLSTKDSIK